MAKLNEIQDFFKKVLNGMTYVCFAVIVVAYLKAGFKWYDRCVRCGHVEHTFGSGGVQLAAADYGVAVLGEASLGVVRFVHFMGQVGF